MTGDAHQTLMDSCGCCGAGPEPIARYNLPGLPAVQYRAGTHSTFLARMLALLSRTPVVVLDPDDPGRVGQLFPLRTLTSRARDDPTVALLDAASMVADVLTFYQERIFNEGLLRTATERRSILELARAIGYELNPGVAASTFLAFTVDDAPGSPAQVRVPKYTRAQSIPSGDGTPQPFETMQEIDARAEWNELRPRLTQPQRLAILSGEEDTLFQIGLDPALAGPGSDVQLVDQIADVYLVSGPTLTQEKLPVGAVPVQVIYVAGAGGGVDTGDFVLIAGMGPDNDMKAIFREIRSVEREPALNRTALYLADKAPPPTFSPPPPSTPTVALASTSVSVDAVGNTLGIGVWESSEWQAFILYQAWQAGWVAQILQTPMPAPLPAPEVGVFSFRERAGFFGHNAPLWGSLPPGESLRDDPYDENNWEDLNNDQGPDIWHDSQGRAYPTTQEHDAYLERDVPGLLNNSWVVFDGAVADPGRPRKHSHYRLDDAGDVSLADYGLSAKCTGLTLRTADGAALDRDQEPVFLTKKTTAYVGSSRLELSDLPIEDPFPVEPRTLMLNHRGLLYWKPGQFLEVAGQPMGAAPGMTQREIAVLEGVRYEDGYTVLTLRDGLKSQYDRATVKLNANVAPATHGETVGKEVLGSGDASRPNQSFVLRKPPLTYVTASAPSGAESSLAVRVNDILWLESPSLFRSAPRSEEFMVRIDHDGKTRLVFGDGERGARLPSGRENIVATYRTGIGPNGEVEADTITLLQTRPLGIRSVTNPVPATGSAAPETRDMSRVSAPRTVLTLDRIVSLQDYEDFASSFAGIGKAKAAYIWRGESRVVHITIGTAQGGSIPSDSPQLESLTGAIHEFKDPRQPVEVAGFVLRRFTLSGSVLVDSRFDVQTVFGGIETALRTAFAFANRTFGQSVSAAEVVTVIQAVPGVVAVDLNDLHLTLGTGAEATPRLWSFIPARPARWMEDHIEPAELLVLDPIGVTLTEMEEP